MYNGTSEKMNRIVINMLKTLTETQKLNRKDHFKKLAFAYNNTKNKTTGYSPQFSFAQ